MFTVPLLWKGLLLLQFIFFLFFFCIMQFKFVHSELTNRSINSFHSDVSNFPINLGGKKQLEGNEGHLCFSITLLYTVYRWTFARLHNMFLIIQKNKNSTQFQTIKKGVANVIARCFWRSYVHKILSMQWLASYLLIHKMHDRPQWCALLYYFHVFTILWRTQPGEKKILYLPQLPTRLLIRNNKKLLTYSIIRNDVKEIVHKLLTYVYANKSTW